MSAQTQGQVAWRVQKDMSRPHFLAKIKKQQLHPQGPEAAAGARRRRRCSNERFHSVGLVGTAGGQQRLAAGTGVGAAARLMQPPRLGGLLTKATVRGFLHHFGLCGLQFKPQLHHFLEF